MHRHTRSLVVTAACLGLTLATTVQSSELSPTKEQVSNLYPGKTYSPYAQRSFPSRVYWGDTHLHTGLSLDAGVFGNTLRPKDAWAFAKGAEITSSTGLKVRLGRPLDWMVLTDHSDMMGFAPDVQAGTPEVLANEKSRGWHEGYAQGGEAAANAAFDLIGTFSQLKMPPDLLEAYSPGATVYDDIWKEIVNAAEDANEPGHFSAFIGFEWTSVPQGFNLHRNVMIRDGADKALQVSPAVTQDPVGDTDPKYLYDWMENYASLGGTATTFAHNGNLSNGWMFPTEKTYHGGEVDLEYVTRRAKWEVHYEVTQIKGDGEAHPYLSPDDEFADYDNWDVGNLDLSQLKTDDMLAGEYAREALKQGLALEEKFGINPYKFGMGGATDSHTALATAEEDNYFGKSVSVEPSAERVKHPFVSSDQATFPGDILVSSGYTGVWAKENTREAIYDAFVRKETYATTGPRMMVRFFGGWDFTEDDLRGRQPAFAGYGRGVPMGGDMPPANSASAPTFMVYALRDPVGANLDRIQVVKGWMEADGSLQEKVYDVAWSDGREPDANGKIPAVGDTVDLEAASWTNTIGASELATVWTDPDFDAQERAFYYARVLEIPTPRWLVYDAVRLGAEIPEGAVLTGQERAYTSPIWYTPQ